MDLPCIKCGVANNVTLNLTDGDTVYCSDCNTEYSVGDVREVIAAWGPILKWVESHPARQPEAVEVG